MKKLFLIVAALFVAVSFSACSDDDDNKFNPELIVGKWERGRSVGYESRDGVVFEETDHTETNSFIIFNADGSGYFYYETDENSGNYATDNFLYKLNDKILQIYDGLGWDDYDQYTECTIRKLSHDELVLFSSGTSIDEDGSIYYGENTEYCRRCK